VRRRRLPSKRQRTPENLLVLRESTTDLKYLEQVVTIRFPIRAAVSYLQRNMGNSIRYKLVEVRRGEAVGVVREVEVRHANSGQRTFVTGDRVLANGQPASFYVPDHLVTIVPRVQGTARETRSLGLDDEVVLHVPVRSYLRFLPGIFQGEGPVTAREVVRTRSSALQKYGSGVPEEQTVDIRIDDDPMRRFLFIFQHLQTRVTDKVDALSELIDPLMTDAKFLPWLASWVGFDLDGSLPIHQQRELVRRAIRLYRTRGTRRGIEEMVRVLTSAPVRIRERVKPPVAVLGKATLVGGKDVVDRYRRGESAASYLLDPKDRAGTSFFVLTLEPRERFKERFGERATGVIRRIVGVVSQERPVHIRFTIQFDQRG